MWIFSEGSIKFQNLDIEIRTNEKDHTYFITKQDNSILLSSKPEGKILYTIWVHDQNEFIVIDNSIIFYNLWCSIYYGNNSKIIIRYSFGSDLNENERNVEFIRFKDMGITQVGTYSILVGPPNGNDMFPQIVAVSHQQYKSFKRFFSSLEFFYVGNVTKKENICFLVFDNQNSIHPVGKSKLTKIERHIKIERNQEVQLFRSTKKLIYVQIDNAKWCVYRDSIRSIVPMQDLKLILRPGNMVYLWTPRKKVIVKFDVYHHSQNMSIRFGKEKKYRTTRMIENIESIQTRKEIPPTDRGNQLCFYELGSGFPGIDI